jgi:hypothetical protein
MDPPEVADHECVAAVRLVGRPVGQAQVPGGVFVSRVLREVRVLVRGARLDLAPVAVEHVLAGLDEARDVLNGSLVEGVARHATSIRPVATRSPAGGISGATVHRS